MAIRRVSQPIADGDPNQYDPYLTDLLDPTAGVTADGYQPPQEPVPTARYVAPTSGPAPSPKQLDGYAAADAGTPSYPTGITTIPDGGGGEVTVPPPELAPPPTPIAPPTAAHIETVPEPAFIQPAPPIQPMDVTPSVPMGEPIGTQPPPPAPPTTGDTTPAGTTPPPPPPPEEVPPAPPETVAAEQPALPEFTPEENIIQGVIAPPVNERAEGLENLSEATLLSDIGRMYSEPEILPGVDPRITRMQQQQDETLEKIFSGPDRFKLGEERWKDWLSKTQPDYEQLIRSATEEAAAHGRLHSGMLTSRYGDVATQRAREMDITGREFLREALEGSVQDRERALAAIRGVLGEERGEQRAVRGEQRGERETGFSRRASARDELTGQARYARGVGAAEREELRGERGYQAGTAAEAIARRIMQRELENKEQQQGFSNALQMLQAGTSGNPSDAELEASARAAAEAAGYTGDIGELLRYFALMQTLNQGQQQTP